MLAVVAPASPFDRDELFRGLAWLHTRYRLRLSSSILTRSGYTAGDVARRSAELSRAMLDPEVDAIICARGGYGAMHLIDALPWPAFAKKPKWLIGFSDVTSLHVVCTAQGVCSLHAPNVTGLGRSITPLERLDLINALEALPRRAWTGLEVVHPGPNGPTAQGPLVGGNLALVAAMAAANRLVIPDGAILALEDVTERPYRLDRMLTSLILGGHLAKLSALVLGGFTQCDPGPDGVTAAAALKVLTASLPSPVVAGAPFGHGAPNRSFVLGARATLDGTTLRFGA
jgi:muramoyltetrapeptide carboxypeptidase